MYTSIWWYLRILPVLHRPELVIIGVYIEKHVICLKDYIIRSFFKYSVCAWRLCKHLGIYSSTDLYDRLVLESIPKCLRKSPCTCRILKNDLII